MYPRNATSPEPIAIGAVVQISDGAVQTSGCTVRIKPIGVAEGDGAGTTAYSTDGIVLYTPTQAETNYTSFILIAKKTGCIPVSVTVVTTSSATPGTVLLAPVTHTSAVIPTVSALTGHTPQTGDSYAIVNSGTHGNAALKTLIDAVDNFIDTEIAAIISTLGTPAGASIAADLVVIDNFVDDLESRLTATRAGYLDEIDVIYQNAYDGITARMLANVTHISGGTPASQIRSAVGLASADLDTQLSSISGKVDAVDDYIDTELAALTSSVGSLYTTALTQSYRSAGSAPTMAQFVFETIAQLGDCSITGTTKTLNNLAGSAAKTFTLDSATTPTSITEAT